MSAAPRIRPATPADVRVLATLRRELFHEVDLARTSAADGFLETCVTASEQMFEAERGVAWLAEADGGEAVGTITLLFGSRLPTPALPGIDEGYVVGVFTRSAWRDRGLATAMLRVALDEARRRGIARVRLHATKKGRRIYEVLGFKARSDEMQVEIG